VQNGGTLRWKSGDRSIVTCRGFRARSQPSRSFPSQSNHLGLSLHSQPPPMSVTLHRGPRSWKRIRSA